MIKENNGITLITLAITIIILLILASITTYSGIDTIKSSRLTKYKTQLEMVQAQVDVLYEKYKDTTDEIEIGKEITASDEEKAVKALETIGVNSLSGYKIFDKEVLQELGVEGIDDTYIVNIKEREVLSLNPIKYEGREYYNLAQLVGERKVEYELDRGEVTFNVKTEQLEDSWKINITDIKLSKYVGKCKVQYQDTKTGKWTIVENNLTADNYNFILKKSGTYIIKITDSAGIACEKSVNLVRYVDIEIPATVILSESRNISGGEFSFTVGNVTKGNIMPIKNSFKNDKNGNIKFSIRIYDEGENKFQITQIPGTDSTIVYDNTIFDITVITQKNSEGNLEMKELYAQRGEWEDQTGGNYVEQIVFRNIVPE